jgi:hypothetical protein
MSLSRRHFVYVASLFTLASAAGPSIFAEDESQATSETFSDEVVTNLGNLTLHDFETLIGERFSISLAGKSLGKLTLIEAAKADPPKASLSPRTVGRAARPASTPALTGFLLRFQGAGGTLPQDSYTMQQGGLGVFPLFLVPEGPKSSHPTYVAIFTRFAGAAPSAPTAPTE